jgi:hypothetical protein
MSWNLSTTQKKIKYSQTYYTRSCQVWSKNTKSKILHISKTKI